MTLSDKLDNIIKGNKIISENKINYNSKFDNIKFLFFCELLNYKNLYKVAYSNGNEISNWSKLIKNLNNYTSPYIAEPLPANSSDKRLIYIDTNILKKSIS